MSKPKKVYVRKSLDYFTKQHKWVKDMASDEVFMKLLQSENKAYFNIVKSTWDRKSYSSAPIVKRNLRTTCERYKNYLEILK